MSAKVLTFALLVLLLPSQATAHVVRVATYNLENYLSMDRIVREQWRPNYPKSEKEKHALRNIIHSVQPDILALQEMGPIPYLRELQRDLKSDGIAYPYAHVLVANDKVRHVAVLSRIPFKEVIDHIDLDFPYFGERSTVKRGLLEVVFDAGGREWSLFVVHLKSKWTERNDDPQATRKRIGEATAARNRILERHDPGEGALYLIAGDLNDTIGSPTVRRFLRRGPVTISHPVSASDSRGHRWTQHWARQDLYSRIDYFLVSPALRPMIVEDRAVIYDGTGWDVASDHRLLWLDLEFSDANGGPNSETR